MKEWQSIGNKNYQSSQTVKFNKLSCFELTSDILNITNGFFLRRNLDMNKNKIVNLEPGTEPNDAVIFSQLRKLGDDYILKAGDSMNGILDMNLNKITNLIQGSEPNDAVIYSQLRNLGDDYILKTGDSMNGYLDMNKNKIINLIPGSEPNDAVNFSQLKDLSDEHVSKTGDFMNGNLDMNLNKITNLITGREPNDAVNYIQLQNKADISYVDIQNTFKADISYVNIQNDLKADLEYVKQKFVDVSSNQIIEGSKTFLNKVIFGNDVKTNLSAMDIPNNGTRNWLDSSETQTIEGNKIFLNDIIFNKVSFNQNQIKNISSATDDGDAVNKQQMDNNLNLRILKSGDTMSGSLSIMNDAGYNGILTLDTGDGSYKRIANQRFFSTFFNTMSPDYKSRRTADIISGYNSTKYIGDNTNGNWGSEYLTFNVGKNGLTNENDEITSEKLRITANGNIGIGTTNPVETLDVSGNTKISGSLFVTSNVCKPNVSKMFNLITKNNELWFNPFFSNQSWNSLIETGDKGIIFSEGSVGTGNLVIGNWGDAGIKIIGSNGNVGISDKNPTNKLTICENASNLLTTTLSSSKIIQIKTLQTNNIIYDVYELNSGMFVFELPNMNQTDEIMMNRVIYFKINGAQVSLTSASPVSSTEQIANNINIDGTNYLSESCIKTSSFILIGTNVIGYYTTKNYQPINNIDQLCIKSKLGTNANNEFSGIKFSGTNTDIGFIRVDTNREHKDSNMSFYTRYSDSVIKPLVINNTINAYKPIIRNEWTSGELIHTQIYNELNHETGELIISSNIEGKEKNSTWKTFSYEVKNKDITDSIIEIHIDVPYLIKNLENDNEFIQIRIYEETHTPIETTSEFITKKTLFYNNNILNNHCVLPLTTTYTPSQNLTQSTRSIKIDFINKSKNGKLMICYDIDEMDINNAQIKNKWIVKINEYKK